ncbi:MAG: alpha/beta fold hydrolase, partial [bacterium]|nr:alpha/beta fold hydrolase [bacterium]
VALSCALSSPGQWGGLALIGTGARLRIAPELLDRVRTHFEETVELAIQWAFSPNAPAALIEQGKKDLLAFPPDVLHGDYNACNRFDVMERLHEIDMPTLVVCGDEDRLTPPKYARYLAEKIQGARLEIISGAGHMSMLERPAALGRSMAEFLSGE